MEAYTSFAQVYDLFMDNVPYEEWGQRLEDILTAYGIKDGLLLDLGCGTGKLTRIMQQKGYDMIGVDYSYEMLDIARSYMDEDVQKSDEDTDDGADTIEAREILYLLQDMREFELYGTVRGVYSACDSVNYILEEEELRTVFSLVNNYLDPGGIFIFDFNPTYKYKELLADNTFAENREEGSFIWENYYDEDEGINEYDLTLYIKEEEKYLRFEETHYQAAYDLNTIQRLLTEAGMEFVAAYDGYSEAAANEESERILVVAREKGKS